MSKVYYVDGKISGVDVDIQLIRDLLPNDLFAAKKTLKVVEDVLDIEKERESELVQVDVSEGTYVRAIRFEEDGSFNLIFNEGTEKEMSSDVSFYRIGEKTYRLHTSYENSCDLNFNRHVMGINKIMKYKEFILKTPNSVWIDVLYEDFPRARDNYPDVYYNMNDNRLIISRIEQFRSYVTVAIQTAIHSIPDQSDQYIIMVDFCSLSASIMRDIVQGCNSGRMFSIKMLHYDDRVNYSELGSIYFVLDVWINPVSVDLNIVAAPRARYDFNERVSASLGSKLKFLFDGSVLLMGQYSPILDCYVDNDTAYSLSTGDYFYSQFMYVPHKPWSLVAISTRDSPVKIYYKDHSELDAFQRLRERASMLLKQILISAQRNYKMADDRTRQKMVNHKDLEEYVLSNNKIPQERWYYSQVMKMPIPLKVKMVAQEDYTIKQSIDLISKVSELEDEISYNRNELSLKGWSDNLISRAISIGLLTSWKEGTSFVYFKYKDKVMLPKNIVINVKKPSASIVLPDGSIVKNNPRNELEDRVVTYPSHVFDEGSYSKHIPYSEERANSDRPDGLNLSYTYSRSPVESVNPVIDKGKSRSSNKGGQRKRYGKRKNKKKKLRKVQEYQENSVDTTDQGFRSSWSSGILDDVPIEQFVTNNDPHSNGLLFTYVPGNPDIGRLFGNTQEFPLFVPVRLPEWPKT
jgi:hypothetical protein